MKVAQTIQHGPAVGHSANIQKETLGLICIHGEARSNLTEDSSTSQLGKRAEVLHP